MDKRKRHNLLLALAIAILVLGALSQLYLMVNQGESSGTQQSVEKEAAQQNQAEPTPQ